MAAYVLGSHFCIPLNFFATPPPKPVESFHSSSHNYMGLLGTSLIQSQNPKGAPPSSKPTVASATADLPFWASTWPLFSHYVPSTNIFLAANPETNLSHITGHLHQRDEIRHEKSLKLAGVFMGFLFVRSSGSSLFFFVLFCLFYKRNTPNLP